MVALKFLSDARVTKRTFSFLTLVFIIWSVTFIYRTSFIAIDGKRYFCLFDDAMISLRYAWNFSHGHGLVWNAGEYIQGYTNLLMTLLMSLATLLFDKSTAALAIQILGVGFMLAIAYANMQISDIVFADRDDPQRIFLRILSFVFALSYYPLMYWSLTGMETGLLTVLLLFGVNAALKFVKQDSKLELFKTAFYLGLAFLTRNDSLIFAVLTWGYVLWSTVQKNQGMRPVFKLFLPVLVFLAFVGGQFLFQYLYYGEMMPNTYILKLTGMSLPDRLSNGFAFIMPFLVQIGFILIPAMIHLFLHFSKERLLLLSLFLSAVAYQIYVGGDAWNYWRMMSPTVPLLGILFIGMVFQGVHSQAGKLPSRSKLSANSQIALVVVTGIVVINSYFLPEVLFLERPFYTSANQHNVNIAIALNEVTTPDATAGVFWAGAIPYFAERDGIDFLGKSDRYIAHLPPDLSGKVGLGGMKSPPGHNKYDLDYSIKQLLPTHVQDFKWGRQDLTAWSKTMYVEVNYKGVQLFLLKDSPYVLWQKIDHP